MTHPGIGVGTWAWGNQFLWGYDPSHDAELEATFKAAVAADLPFFDSADSYGTGRFNGRSEALLGRFAAALPALQRDRLCLATKLAPFPWRLGRSGYRRAFAASRRRLGGRIDRVQLHWSTARYAPWQELPLIDGLADLVERGEVAELGVSNMGPRRLRQVQAHLADRGIRLASLQVQFSLLAPEPIAPGGIRDTCEELGIELLAYSPLALGLLARRLGEGCDGLTGARRVLFARLGPGLAELLAAMEGIAAPHGASLAAVALNWCRSHGAVPIPGLRRTTQVAEAQAALGWQLQDGERQALDRLALALPIRMPANPFQSA
ncbi:MAG: aldo/keto reductase [Cyanobacteriota bacterium]